MRNFGLILLAGGAAIAGLGFFMRKGEDADDTDANIVPTDPAKPKKAEAIREHPGELNLSGDLKIEMVLPIYS